MSELEKELRQVFDSVDEDGNVHFTMNIEHAAALLDVLKFTTGAAETLASQQSLMGRGDESSRYVEIGECATILYKIIIKTMGTEIPDGETVH